MICVILPAYNESSELPELLRRFDQLASRYEEPIRIIVVDDGSTDGTAEAARSTAVGFDLEVVVHDNNQGLGGALRTGLERAAETLSTDDAVVTMDADNTHSPDYVPDMRAKMNRDNLDFVVASRYARGGKEIGVPRFRRVLSRGASMLYSFMFGIRGVSDYTCGYRMIGAGALKKTLEAYGDRIIEERGFPATGELMLKISRVTDRFGEVPFALRYDLKRGASKMRKMLTVWRTLRVIWKYRKLASR